MPVEGLSKRNQMQDKEAGRLRHHYQENQKNPKSQNTKTYDKPEISREQTQEHTRHIRRNAGPENRYRYTEKHRLYYTGVGET